MRMHPYMLFLWFYIHFSSHLKWTLCQFCEIAKLDPPRWVISDPNTAIFVYRLRNGGLVQWLNKAEIIIQQEQTFNKGIRKYCPSCRYEWAHCWPKSVKYGHALYLYNDWCKSSENFYTTKSFTFTVCWIMSKMFKMSMINAHMLKYGPRINDPLLNVLCIFWSGSFVEPIMYMMWNRDNYHFHDWLSICSSFSSNWSFWFKFKKGLWELDYISE